MRKELELAMAGGNYSLKIRKCLYILSAHRNFSTLHVASSVEEMCREPFNNGKNSLFHSVIAKHNFNFFMARHTI